MLTPQELLSHSLLWISQISNRARCPLTHIGHGNTLSPWSCGFSLCLAIICSQAVSDGYSLLTRPHLRRADAALIKALFTADFLSPLVELQTHFQIFPWRRNGKSMPDWLLKARFHSGSALLALLICFSSLPTFFQVRW